MTLRSWKTKYAKDKTLREIAGEAGVSLSVVFRALHGIRVSHQNMKQLVAYTDGKVTYEDLFESSPFVTPPAA